MLGWLGSSAARRAVSEQFGASQHSHCHRRATAPKHEVGGSSLQAGVRGLVINVFLFYV